MKRLQAASLALGLALFAYLLYSVGLGQVLRSLQLVGSGFIVLVLVSGARHLLRAAAWQKCFAAGRCPLGLFELFHVRLAGEAIRYLSFTGPLLAEPAKAALIRKRLPLAHGLSSVIVENLTYTLGAVLITLVGLALLLAHVALNDYLKLAAILISLGAVAAIALMWRCIARRTFVLGRSMRRLERLTGKGWFAAQAAGVERMEENVFNFYHHRERTFLPVLALELAAQLVNIFEVYLILSFMGVEASFLAAFIIEAVMKLINFAFFFVPGQVGVLEGGNALLFRALGLGATTGIALALVEKIRTLAWTAYGLVALTLLLRRNARTTPQYEDEDKGAELLAEARSFR